ncbi:unnamed protein product [Rotaria sp. Silwood1]|nr:unnamed protein product [Rotaria sp. Silwood1]CAF0962987.1 unnamed protein product [Rotaria sp. Silwood1]CAF3361051.1 unnamed protein product [Rotaria sp. Silwood1]CAF3361881.1 unnamed protein product [Rotaria sp. Silwood1]CAF3402591.1 unnamed protein product [Rotaria sp. Silwood1]
MTSNETSTKEQRLMDENFLRLESIDEHGNTNEQLLRKQSQDRSSSLFPPITRNVVSGLAIANNSIESPRLSPLYNPLVREAARRFALRQNLSISTDSSAANMPGYARPKRMSLYKYIQPRIDTGLPRRESLTRRNIDTYQLGPTRSINWRLLKQQLEQNTDISNLAKRIQFYSGITYTKQLKTLATQVQLKVRQYLASIMALGEERFKIVANVTVIPKTVSGLFIASRCLWNQATDNSITIEMQGVDCRILIVVFLCYTDLGPMPY